MTQYLYIIRCREFYKIGVANDVESRLAQLSTGNPFPLEVQVLYEFENAEPIERALHQRYKENRVRGEWFKLEYDDQKNIHSVCLSLGGRAYEYTGQEATEEVIEEAEHSAVLEDGGKWDYAAMFADGWRMEPTSSKGKNGIYWAWRKAENGKRAYIYGGVISELPFPMHEMKMRFAVVPLGTIKADNTNTETK